jgi:hypothetical protein
LRVSRVKTIHPTPFLSSIFITGMDKKKMICFLFK